MYMQQIKKVLINQIDIQGIYIDLYLEDVRKDMCCSGLRHVMRPLQGPGFEAQVPYGIMLNNGLLPLLHTRLLSSNDLHGLLNPVGVHRHLCLLASNTYDLKF
jgi:hypothetical protein